MNRSMEKTRKASGSILGARLIPLLVSALFLSTPASAQLSNPSQANLNNNFPYPPGVTTGSPELDKIAGLAALVRSFYAYLPGCYTPPGCSVPSYYYPWGMPGYGYPYGYPYSYGYAYPPGYGAPYNMPYPGGGFGYPGQPAPMQPGSQPPAPSSNNAPAGSPLAAPPPAQKAAAQTMQPPPFYILPVGKEVAYIRINRLEPGITIKQQLLPFLQISDRLTNGLVLDLRDVSGGTLSDLLDLVSLFQEEGRVVSVSFNQTKATTANAKSKAKPVPQVEVVYKLTSSNIVPTTFVAGQSEPTVPKELPERLPPVAKAKPLAILINQGTSGAMAIAANALKQSGKAYLIGTKMAPNCVIPLAVHREDGTLSPIKDAAFMGPDGSCLGNTTKPCSKGVSPSFSEVKAKPGIVFGTENDNQLDAALKALNLVKPAQ